MLQTNNGINAVLYLRLSRDEAKKSESLSITNQRRILEDYAEKKGFLVTGEYVDDGISGATFERPAFIQMIEDGKEKKFDIIIVKDLSRLGREHISADDHIERIFPKMGIRFISLQENYDSNNDDDATSDMLPFINLFNEFHAKSTSRKTKATKMSMAKAGKFQGSKAPFGYVLDPLDKYHLVIDPEAAETVAFIFNLACDGYGFKAIGRVLREEKRLNPSAYCLEKNPDHYQSEYWKQPHDWHASSIKGILYNQCYLGHMVNGKRRVPSFKMKKPVKMPEDTWVIVENTHEAIVDKVTWKQAHEKISVRTRTDSQGAIQMFAGLVKCYDCGYALHFTQSGKNRQTPRFQCSLYNIKGKAYCKSHFITYNDLYKIVLDDVRRRARCAAHLDAQLISKLQKEASSTLQNQRKSLKKEFDNLQERIEKIDKILPQIYEDSLVGMIPRERALEMMKKYEAEQQELRQQLTVSQEKLESYEEKYSELEVITKAVAEYKDLQSLNATILNELISEIRVGVKEKINGEKVQKVKIVYRQACFVEYFDELDFEVLKNSEDLEKAFFNEIINY